MSESNEDIGFLAKHKKKIEIAILAVVVVILAISLIRAFKSDSEETKRVICYKCKYNEVRDIDPSKMEFYKCSQCGENIGIAWKCRDCKYEFPIVIRPAPENLKENEKPEYYLNYCRCPNCSSYNTDPMLIKEPKK
ncbi:MAG TPA: hypothetical protein PK821_04550 [Victivallales bacterium]|nr:hypothetical protein [Victivallales bacterium]